MLTVELQGKTYTLNLDEQLKSLKGSESILVEDYLGGWDQFRSPQNRTRTAIVLIWLAMRANGEASTFDEIADIPGLVFGDALQLTDDDEPVDPMEDPGHPLAQPSGANDTSDGTDVSEDGPETSDNSGPPALPVGMG